MDNSALTFIVFALIGALAGFIIAMRRAWFRLHKWGIDQQRQLDDLKRELEELKQK